MGFFEDENEEDIDKEFDFDWNTWETYVFPIDLNREFESTERALGYLTSILMNQKFGWINSRIQYLNPPRFYEDIIVFCDRWGIPFDPTFHKMLMYSLQNYNPPWRNSDWGC